MNVIDRATRVIAGVILAAFMVAAVGTNAANAQQPLGGPLGGDAQQTPSVSSFLANPVRLLQQNPEGGSLLTNTVEQIALTDPSTFGALLGLLPNANEVQRGAIGRGLAQAAKVLVLTNQEVAVEWQRQIALVDDPSFKTAAAEALGDVKLGAVGGGEGTGLGGPGGGLGGGGPLEDIRSPGFTTQPFTFGSAGVTGSGGSGGTTSSSNSVGFTSCVTGVNCSCVGANCPAINPVSSSVQ